MSDILPPEKTDIAVSSSPELVKVWRWQVRSGWATVIKASVALSAIGVAGWLIQNFLQLRGIVNLVASQVDLAFIAVALFVAASALTIGLRHKRLWRVLIGIGLIVAAYLVDRFVPKPQATTLSNATTHDRPSDWRTIKDWQKAELAPVLEQYPNYTLHIVASGVSDETWDYANQFKDFFSAHKWKVIGPETSSPDQIVLNMQLSISEQYWGKERPDAFTALESALKFIHVKNTPNFVVDPLVRPDELVMWIGPETPPGYPQHIPLQLETICRNPLSFEDAPLRFIGSALTEPARFIRIFPSRPRFLKGDELLVLLTGYASEVGNDPAFTVQALGKTMPRPDALDILIVKDLKVGEPLLMKIISKKELSVRCAQDRSAEPGASNTASATTTPSPKVSSPVKDPIYWSQQDVPSDANEWQARKLVTIQTEETIENPNFRVLCDAPCFFGKLDMGTNAIYGTNRQAGDKTVEAGIRQSFTPRTPLTVVLYGHDPFMVTQVERIF